MKKVVILLIASLVFPAILLMKQFYRSPSVAQVCYYETESGEVIDLSEMCTPESEDPAQEVTPSESNNQGQEANPGQEAVPPAQEAVPPDEDDMTYSPEGEIVQAILDEANEISAARGFRTEAELKNLIREICEEPGRCPDSFIAEIESWYDDNT
ncbi:MAG: hypothetical protein AAGF01_09680 [Cyanobacteria bacterium P01_G01_bin.38]